MTIQERVLETMFGIAVEEKGVCEKMGRLTTSGISFVWIIPQMIK